jgi:internalin A
VHSSGISYDSYESLCRDEGLTNEDTLVTLVDFLNDLGVVVRFDSPVLRETNVINPTWITAAVYSIINSKQLADGHGLLERAALRGYLINPDTLHENTTTSWS